MRYFGIHMAQRKKELRLERKKLENIAKTAFDVLIFRKTKAQQQGFAKQKVDDREKGCCLCTRSLHPS